MRWRISPIHRISFAITMLTISLLVFSDIIGLMPNKQNAILAERKQVAEALTIQLSVLAAKDELSALRATLQNVVRRNPMILSVALRKAGGEITFAYGNHERHWYDHPGERSTLTHVRVPINRGGQAWGAVEIRFADLDSRGLSGYLHNSLFGLIAFLALFGFLSYMLFLRRALRALDPSAVIPDRVRSAFDLMAEGIAIMDEKGHVVLANKALGDHLGIDPGELIGKDMSRMAWKRPSGENTLPWERARQQNERRMGVPLILESDQESDNDALFAVNSAPIKDNKGIVRGVFTTFDDMTILEKKNAELSNALDQLTLSKTEIVRQNQELHYLATRDPMTGVLNRRALFVEFQKIFDEARSHGTPLTSMMVDIDHFKAVNDTYGHATGDEVIKLVANLLKTIVGERGFVGRYGGEEFAVILPQTDLDGAYEVAETIRKQVLAASQTDAVPVQRVTASLGVSILGPELDSPDALIDLADQALYRAKTSGRNRVLRSDQLENIFPPAANETPSQSGESAREARRESESMAARIAELKVLAEDRQASLEQGLLYDAQTGLPNRKLLKEKIEEAMARQERSGGYGAVVSLNVSAFDNVVKACGYDVADAFMKNIAEKLREHVRITDTVVSGAEPDDQTLDFYRINSSELGILLSDLESRNGAVAVLGRLEQMLEQPIQVGDGEFLPHAEMGVALHPLDGNDAETLLRKASAARQLPNHPSGEHHFKFFSQRMNDYAHNQLQMESEIQHALENGEFELWYQPKLSLATGRITGLEGLIRWQHPEHGMVPPDKFIPVAEQSNLIKRIGMWVVEEALRQLRDWSGTEFESIHIAVNVSPVQFLEPRFAEMLVAAANDIAVNLERLDLELTEGVLLEDPDKARSTMNELAGHGINLHLDDFGTGYSSLSYLKKLPIDGLKIDRSFTQDIVDSRQEQAIVRSIIDLAQGLELGLVAEGIETQEQLDTMSRLGCSEFQGYFISKPKPVAALTEFLRHPQAGRHCKAPPRTTTTSPHPAFDLGQMIQGLSQD